MLEKIQKHRLPILGIVLVGLLILVVIPALWNSLVARSDAAAERDRARLRDVEILQGMLEDYFFENGYYPPSTTVEPYIDSSAYHQPNRPWIEGLRNNSQIMLPIDPNNSGEYVYRYRSSAPPAQFYELTTKLERDEDGLMDSDGGINDNLYEVGTDLTLID